MGSHPVSAWCRDCPGHPERGGNVVSRASMRVGATVSSFRTKNSGARGLVRLRPAECHVVECGRWRWRYSRGRRGVCRAPCTRRAADLPDEHGRRRHRKPTGRDPPTPRRGEPSRLVYSPLRPLPYLGPQHVEDKHEHLTCRAQLDGVTAAPSSGMDRRDRVSLRLRGCTQFALVRRFNKCNGV